MGAVTAGRKQTAWNLAGLADVSGCPPRTIRYYIARGLLPPPRKGGPGAHYGPEHLERLRQIRAWQAEGLTLAEIGHRLAAQESRPVVPLEKTAWWCYPVAPEVTVYVRADTAPWRLRTIQRELQELADRLGAQGNGKETQHADEP